MPYGFNADDDDVNVNTCNKNITSKVIEMIHWANFSLCASFIVIFQVCNHPEKEYDNVLPFNVVLKFMQITKTEDYFFVKIRINTVVIISIFFKKLYLPCEVLVFHK